MITREQLSKKIFNLFLVVSNGAKNPVLESHTLRDDLLLSATLVRGLAITYSKISTAFGGTKITQPQAAGYQTVAEVIDGIFKSIEDGKNE